MWEIGIESGDLGKQERCWPNLFGLAQRWQGFLGEQQIAVMKNHIKRCSCHCRIPNSEPRLCTGFTLIEILVVVVILAVLAGALTLAAGGVGGERQLAREAARAQALIGYACEQAELVDRQIGISLNDHGYRFSRLERSNWLPIRTDELRPRQWLTGTNVALTRDGHRVLIDAQFPEKPQLVCFSSGELTPFRLEMALSDLDQRYRLDGQPDGTVTLTAVQTHAR